MANTKFTGFTEKTSFDDMDDVIPIVDVSAGSVAAATKKVKIGTVLNKIQDGSTVYAASSSGNDSYAVTLSPVPTAYTTGMVVNFKADVANTGAATLNVNSLGAKTIKKNHDQDLSDNDIESGQVVSVVYDGTNFEMQSQLANAGITTSGTETITGGKTFSGNNTFSGTNTHTGTELFTGPLIGKLYAPQGFLINGKISPTVSSNNLTLSVKTLAGTDPSATDPVYIRIGDTVREITSALSVTANAATNWFNSGSSELATKEIDYFVYLGYNSTDGVVLGFSRIPGATKYGDFNATSTNEKYCRISTITTAASTDYYENVGRFAATLSAGAGYTWTVPTYTADNLIQRPIYESRWLDILPVFAVSGGTAPTYTSSAYKYRVIYDRINYTINQRNSSGGTAGAGANALTFQLPFDPSATVSDDSGGLGYGMSYENAGTICGMMISRNSANKAYGRNVSSVSTITGADQSSADRMYQAQGTYQF